MDRHYPLLRVMAAFIGCGLMALTYARAQSPDQTKQELIQLQNEWATARIKGDVAFLERLYANEFRITAMNGSVVERDADIAVFANRDMKPEIIEDDTMQVSLYDQVAVVTGREHVKGTHKGNPGDFMLRFTNVFVHRDRHWQMTTHHATEVSKK